MAADLAHTPVSGFRVHACGDAHLLNFGAFATPERNLVFDINDHFFDAALRLVGVGSVDTQCAVGLLKISAIIEDWDDNLLREYSKICGLALARAHVRSGDAAMISGYMGSSQTFDEG